MPKAFAEIIQGKLLVEISELDSFNRAEVTRVKQVVTNTSDRFRESYGRLAQDHPRQCVFAGTTNRDDWNRDETGARRFWPIACGDIDLEAIRVNREQFFAEAVFRFEAGEFWHEMPTDETTREQDDRFIEDPWTPIIGNFVGKKDSVTVNEILLVCLRFKKAQIRRPDHMRVATCLHRLGWKKGEKQRVNGDVTPVWTRRAKERSEK